MPGNTPRARWGQQRWDRIGTARAAGCSRGGRGRGENRCFQTSDMAPGLLSETETSEGSRFVRGPFHGHSRLPAGGASQ